MDAAVGLGPEVDAGVIAAAGTLILDQLVVAYFSVGTAGSPTQEFAVQVRAGDTVYFSADGAAVLTLLFDDSAELDHVV